MRKVRQHEEGSIRTSAIMFLRTHEIEAGYTWLVLHGPKDSVLVHDTRTNLLRAIAGLIK